MGNTIQKTIKSYIKLQSRNKIVFYSKNMPGIETLDVGKKLAEVIYNLSNLNQISMRASAELDSLLNSNIHQHFLYGKYLSIDNIGILFEPELKIDFARLLENYSQNNILFLKWEGEIDNENIYFLTKQKGTKISIKNLSHIVLLNEHENH